MRDHRLRFHILAVFFLALAFRVQHLDRMAIWGDEACMVYLCRSSDAEIIQALASPNRPDVDVAPPLYFVMLHHWMATFGDSVGVFRGFSVLWGVLNCLAVLWLGYVLIGPRAGILAGYLAALNPFQVWYSQEGRMYALASFLATCALAFHALVLKRPGKFRYWAGLWIFSTLLIYTQYYGFLLIGAVIAHMVFVAAVHRERDEFVSGALLKGAAGLIAAWLLVYLPWFPVLIGDYTQASAPGGFPGMFHPLKTPVFLLVKMAIFGNEMYILDHPMFYLVSMIVIAVPLILGVLDYRHSGMQAALFTTLLPFLVVYLGTLAGMRVYKSHPFILFQASLIAWIAHGILRSGKWKLVLLTMMLGAHVFVLGTLNFGDQYVKPRVHDAARWVKSQRKPGDCIAVVPAFIPNPMPIVGDLLAFRYYIGETPCVMYLVGDNAEEIVTEIERGWADDGALFLVYQDNDCVRPHVESICGMLREHHEFMEEKRFPSRMRGFTMVVQRYGKAPPGMRAE